MSKNSENQGGEKERSNDNLLSVIIQTPQGDWSTDFPKTSKVSDVIKAIVDHFGFSSEGKYELRLDVNPNEALDPNRPLVSYGVKDGDVLVFIDFGQAV
ncbi:MAG: EsaB/YukD family protein [Cyclobacteriaceae bacterium]